MPIRPRCGARLALIMSYRGADEFDGVDDLGNPIFVPGERIEMWRVCNRRAGHRGDCHSDRKRWWWFR